VIIDKRLQPGLRVTVKMDLARSSETGVRAEYLADLAFVFVWKL
jgi:hypothetical protein